MSHYYTASLEYTNICISMLDDANSKIVTILNECISIESNSNALLDENIRSLIYDVKESCTEIQSKIHSQKENLSDAVYSTQIEDTQSSLSDINSLLIRSKCLTILSKMHILTKWTEYPKTTEMSATNWLAYLIRNSSR